MIISTNISYYLIFYNNYYLIKRYKYNNIIINSIYNIVNLVKFPIDSGIVPLKSLSDRPLILYMGKWINKRILYIFIINI